MAHVPLTRAFIEFIHDVLVGLWMPFDEHVDPADYKDVPLLESAAGRPFQTFGEDLYPTVPQKAAVLFHSLVCNHCFRNGNKRTAVIAVDIFLRMNTHVLAMSNQEIYEVATDTAKANQEGRKPDEVVADLTALFSELSIPISALDPTSEVAQIVGPERVESMVERVNWMGEMLEKLRDTPFSPFTEDREKE